jgi:hypothetical protein
MPIVQSLQKKSSKNYTETVTVKVFYASVGNVYGLTPGWYELTPSLGVPVDQCGDVRVSYLPSEPYRRWLRDQALQNKKRLRRGQLTQDEIDEIDIRAVAMFGLKGWSGFMEKSTGKEQPYTTEVGFNALCNDRSFLDFICDLCRDTGLFGDPDKEAASQIKNS